MVQEGFSVVNSFRDLTVWKKAVELATAVYRLTQQFPREEMYGISAQMRRSAVSVPSNIAEGHGRLGAKEYRQFLSVARGSNFELQTQFEIARSLGYGDVRALDHAESLSNEVGRMIYAIAQRLAHRTEGDSRQLPPVTSEP